MRVLRWLLVFPVAYTAMTLVSIGALALVEWSEPGAVTSRPGSFYQGLLSLVAGAAFIVGGAIVAPEERDRVAHYLLLLTTIWAGVQIVVGGYERDYASVTAPLLLLIGAALGRGAVYSRTRSSTGRPAQARTA